MHLVGNILSELHASEVGTSDGVGNASTSRAADIDIRDPSIIRSKGAPRGSTNAKVARKCRRCNGVGHDKRNCEGVEGQMEDEVAGEEAADGERARGT
ncbi:hypothetical protein PIB30_028972 [Stylosanthes scabra]|uniref:CCHC-type domain-containing protein n=1 Tax=Stylosanthes scabra TaxID=79078 RepID=A0ABU6VA15_9FABA|nr:hypothetical protein [Stylosanthes scabra]